MLSVFQGPPTSAQGLSGPRQARAWSSRSQAAGPGPGLGRALARPGPGLPGLDPGQRQGLRWVVQSLILEPHWFQILTSEIISTLGSGT